MNTIETKSGLNFSVHSPEIEEYKKLLVDDKSTIIELVSAIQHIDRKALSLYYTKNTEEQKSGMKETIIPQYRKLIYQSNHYTYSENEVISTALKDILSILIKDIEEFLYEWDKEKSGYNDALQAININSSKTNLEEIEKVIKDKQDIFQPELLNQADLEKELLILAEELKNEENRKKLENALIDFGKPSFSNITKYAREKINEVLSPVFNRETFDRYSYIIYAVCFSILFNIGEKAIDFSDGHHKEVAELIQEESDKNGEGERKYKIIESEILPILADHVRKINTQGSEIDWGDYNNNVFHFSRVDDNTGKTFIESSYGQSIAHDAHIGSRTCVKIDIADWIPNHEIYFPNQVKNLDNQALEYRLLTPDRKNLVAEKGEVVSGQVVEKECKLGIDKVTEMGLGESTEFLLQILNHPDTTRKIKNDSEKLGID